MNNLLNQVYPTPIGLELMVTYVETALEESGGEITPAIQAQMDEIAKVERVEDLANYYHHLDAQVRGKEAELRPIIEALEAEIKLVEQRRERVKSYLGYAVAPGKSITTDKVSVWYRESSAVDVIDPDVVPIEYTRVKTEPDKRAIAQALKEGKQVPGAQMVINYSLQVDHPGERAKANAKTRERSRAKRTVDQANNIGEA